VRPYRVGIAGATGLVGQRLLARLSAHPWFRIGALGASERSSGRTFAEAARWMLPTAMPEAIARMTVGGCTPSDFAGCDLVLSALDSGPAREIEPELAGAGIAVVSNSAAHRMEPGVPLIIPEVNGARLGAESGTGPRLVTNPNCSVTGLALALAPLHRSFGVRRAIVATLQSVSGAGLSGPRAIEMLDNVVPYIAGEEEKIEAELGKILDASIAVAAHCHRVGTTEGHLEAVSVELARPAGPADAIAAMEAFRGDVEALGLPTAPARPIAVRREPDRPQTRLDRDEGNGMTVVVGRVRPCPVLSLRFVLLSHNMERGAAGGALLNAELLAARGMLPRRSGA